MEKITDRISSLTGCRPLDDKTVEEAISRNGDPIQWLSVLVAASLCGADTDSVEFNAVVRHVRHVLLPIRSVLCRLREERRERIQRAFEEIEAHTDRSAPPAEPEMPSFIVSDNELDDAVYPEEVEEAKRRMRRRRYLRFLRRRAGA